MAAVMTRADSGHLVTSGAMAPPQDQAVTRAGSTRRSLRSLRCQSVVITEKEKTLLIKQTDRKLPGQEGGKVAASKGFVRSMCKFYSDIIGGERRSPRGGRRTGALDRSASFTGVQETVKETSQEVQEELAISPVSSRPGSFRLNRSRSWRGSRLETFAEQLADTPKRNSPTGQSVRSQDSGFSDSGEHMAQELGHDGSYESASSQSPGSDNNNHNNNSFVTKINIEGATDAHQTLNNNQSNFRLQAPISENYSSRTGTTPAARQKVSGSLDNIVSLKEGFKIKLGTEARSLYNQGCGDAAADQTAAAGSSPHVAGLLLRARPAAEDSCAAGPRFSTPVRASFRRRPQTMVFAVDEAGLSTTPVVRRESRTRLKEIKSRRRWSNLDQDQSKLSPLSVNTTQLNIRQSSGSQYCRNSQNSAAAAADSSCYEFRNPSSHLSPSATCAGLQLISPVARDPADTSSPGTLLLPDSFSAASRSVNTIFPPDDAHAQDTIIEHESSSSSQQQTCSTAPATIAANTSSGGQQQARSNQDPVYEWWKDLFIWTEPECMTYLQSKPIPVPAARSRAVSPAAPSSAVSAAAAAAMSRQVPVVYYPYETIRHALEHRGTVADTFAALRSHFSALNLLQMNKTIGQLTKQIRDFVYEHNLRAYSAPLELGGGAAPGAELPGYRAAPGTQPAPAPSASSGREIVQLQETSVLQIVDRLKLCAHRCQYTPSGPLVEMKKSIKSLEEAFAKFIELIISAEMRTVLGVLETRDQDPGAVVDAVNTIINLGNEHSSQMYAVITRVGTIRALVSLATHAGSMEVKLLSLRAISSVCCTIEAVRELEQCRGLATVSNILVSPRTSLTVKVEAAGVLAQITSPWIADNHSIAGLREQVPRLVEQLTKLARVHAGDDTFLLVSAALANLTFMEAAAVVSMQRQHTARALMRVVADSPFTSLFAKDQVVTVLANLAGKEEARHDILAEDGLGFLVTLLATNPEHTATPAETAAAERVLKKTAIALSRLCSDPAVCRQLLALRGLHSLVGLCKDGSLRNYNDAVLVACLAVLRRVAHHCGHDVFDSLDARDLIDPKLMDSFLEYSSKQESYV